MSVEAFSAEARFPFVHFLKDRGEYELSRRFWQNSFEAGLENEDHRRDWKSWMNNPFFDGMPVWSVINRQIRRGVSVQQVEYSKDPVWFKCWINVTDIDPIGGLPYLFVETFVSMSSHQFFVKLIKEWTNAEVSMSRFSKFADDVQTEAMSQLPNAPGL